MKFIYAKKCFTLFSLLFVANLFAQAPQGINYQAIARDASGNALMSRQNMKVRFTITNSSFSEQHTGVTTNQFGLFNLVIGSISPLPDFSLNPPHSIKVEVDTNSSGNYIDMGTTPFQSVPYALYSPSSAGAQGYKSLVNTTPEPAGSNCLTGGHKIDIGLDANNNNTLDASEISQTFYVCHGLAGGSNVSVSTPLTITSGANPTVSITQNTKTTSGYVPQPGIADLNKVWKTNSLGIPAWRDDSLNSSLNNPITASNGLTLNTLNNIQIGGVLIKSTTITTLDTSCNLSLTGNPTSVALFKSISSSAQPAIHGKNTGAGAGILAESTTNGPALKTMTSGTLSALFLGGGSVGIDLPAPSEKLDVNGNIQIPSLNDYKYSTPKTYVKNIPPVAFVPTGTNTNTWHIEAPYPNQVAIYAVASFTPAIAIQLSAPLYLPQSSVITNLTTSFYENLPVIPADSLKMELWRGQLGAVNSKLAEILVTAPNSGTAVSHSLPTNILIDNTSYYYLTYYGFSQSPPISTNWLYGVKITYNVTKTD